MRKIQNHFGNTFLGSFCGLHKELDSKFQNRITENTGNLVN